MELYTVVGSPNCRKVEAVVNKLGIKLDHHYLDFFEGEHRLPEHLARNPNGKVPCLVDGEFTLWESNAINQYLCDRFNGESLLPRDPRGRADVMRWLCWEMNHFNRALSAMLFETVIKPNFGLGESNHDIIQASTQELGRFAPVLEGHLSTRKFLVGDRLTIADYAVIHLEGFLDKLPFDWSPYPSVSAYFAHMRKDEAWAKTAPSSPAAFGRRPKAA